MEKELKVCFAASSGGHLQQLMMMRPLMEKYDSFLITEKTSFMPDTKGVKTYLVSQINRKEWKFPFLLVKNICLSIGIYYKERPDVIVTTGVLAVVPLCLLMKLLGKKVFYVESFANVSKGTMTGKLLYKFADKFYVQWKDLLDVYPNAQFVGGIY